METVVIEQKEKVIVKIAFPKGGITMRELSEFFVGIGNLLPSFDVVISNAPFGQGAN